MKRTSLVLHQQILDAAKTASGLNTYSEVVNLALREYVNRRKFEQLDHFAASDIWQGRLSSMRDDSKAACFREISLSPG